LRGVVGVLGEPGACQGCLECRGSGGWVDLEWAAQEAPVEEPEANRVCPGWEVLEAPVG
jgi:hypothetical protein